jgi:hypothetical protein
MIYKYAVLFLLSIQNISGYLRLNHAVEGKIGEIGTESMVFIEPLERNKCSAHSLKPG